MLTSIFLATSFSMLCLSLWNIISPVSYWFILPISLLISLVLIQIFRISKISEADVSRLLDLTYPQLEESSSLVLKNPEKLNILEKLQLEKIKNEMQSIKTPALIYKRLKISAIFLIISILVSASLVSIDFGTLNNNSLGINKGTTPSIPDKILPEISSIKLKISPPTYTKRNSRVQQQFSATVEEGAILEWVIETSRPVSKLYYIFNDKEKIKLRSLNKTGTQWTISKTINKPGFYQVELDGKLSDLYKLETIKDEPATIRITSPKQYSTIDFGEPQRANLRVQINDDYGINDSYISATISSGEGESVKFKEQVIRFSESINGKQEYKLQKTIDLPSLGMLPGDELYFYINATDSRKQQSRSDVYIVTIQDTAKLMSMDGMLGGINLVPEYFRSQRQIIIDTEKILKEKNSISEEEFKNRSNNLGIDQKLLRLRYGKFLGEETDEEIGEEHEEHTAAEESAAFGDAEKIMDAYAHKHDIAEDATFFEPELKAQLKATLAEMWKSELRLRTYKPEEALPFEYKALRLLKDLQQKSRAYVSKTALKTPTIKTEKRLSAELDKIIQPSAVRTLLKSEEQNALKKSTSIIAKLKEGEKLNQSDFSILQEANRKLAAKASAEPTSYLKALGIMRKILSKSGNGKVSLGELSTMEAAMQRMIKNEGKAPQAKIAPPRTSLSLEYFNSLKRQLP
jgi:protein involved in ribonucleotide reduction